MTHSPSLSMGQWPISPRLMITTPLIFCTQSSETREIGILSAWSELLQKEQMMPAIL